MIQHHPWGTIASCQDPNRQPGRIARLPLACILGLTLGVQAAASDWQVRRMLAADQTSEWTAAGYLPKWNVAVDPDAAGFRIDGDREGKFRGAILVGRTFELPDPMPPGFAVCLQYQTSCALAARSGLLSLAIYAPEAWRQIAESDPPTMSFNIKSPQPQPLAYLRIAEHGEDVEQWRSWQSGNLAHQLRDHAGKTLVLAIVWSAYHFHAEEKAALRNIGLVTQTRADVQREFYQSLDLDRPELAPVRDAVQREDWIAADTALAGHFRRRSEPPSPLLAATTSTAAADEACDHIFRLVGCEPYQLPRDIRWNEDPFDYDQWAIALNRHYHWRTLAAAYVGTKDEKYAREFVAQLRSWIDAMPVLIGTHYVEGPYSAPGRAALSLDAGIRMGQTWIPSLYSFLPSPSFSDGDVVAMLESFRRHADYLMDPRHFKSGSNWGTMESNGLLHIGCFLPEFRDSAAWRETAIQRLYGELDRQVYPDGAQKELTPGYHGVTLRNILEAVHVARHCNQPLPDDFVSKLQQMFDYYVRIRKPDGTTPSLNDSGASSTGGYLARGADLFPEREDFAWFASHGKSGSPPDYTSTRLPYAGWHVMRSGWDADACYMIFDAGPYGTGHQHEDKLSLIVHAFGRTLIPEAGRYSYDGSKWHQYSLSTPAHNTIMVDGLPQRHKAVRSSWEAHQPVDTVWHTSDRLDYAAGSYTLGYGLSENVPVEHHRDILFIKPRLWLVVDRLAAKDDKRHTYESLFHLNADRAEANPEAGAVITANPTGANMAVLPVDLGDWEVQIVQGQEQPAVQGWLTTNRHNVLRPVPTAVYRCTRAGEATIAYVLAPFRQGESVPSVEQLPALPDDAGGGIACRLQMPDGSGLRVLCSASPGEPFSRGPLRTSASAAVFTDAGELVAQVPN